jgi:hypothetical protein
MLVRDEHSSLLEPFVSYTKICSVVNTHPEAYLIEEHLKVVTLL